LYSHHRLTDYQLQSQPLNHHHSYHHQIMTQSREQLNLKLLGKQNTTTTHHQSREEKSSDRRARSREGSSRHKQGITTRPDTNPRGCARRREASQKTKDN
jgi:hypothetical protein